MNNNFYEKTPWFENPIYHGKNLSLETFEKYLEKQKPDFKFIQDDRLDLELEHGIYIQFHIHRDHFYVMSGDHLGFF